jgi:hypothetical protein
MARLAAPKKPRITKNSYYGTAGAVYNCPSIAAIDKHLAAITKSIQQLPEWQTGTLKVLRDDRDMLLDLRLIKAKPAEVPS